MWSAVSAAESAEVGITLGGRGAIYKQALAADPRCVVRYQEQCGCGHVVGLAEATPKKFNLVSQFSVEGQGKSWAHPVVTDGRMYIRYAENLYVFDVKGK